MSTKRRISDHERTAKMLDLIHEAYVDRDAPSMSHVVLEEVAPGVGWAGSSRWADVLVLGIWQNDRGLHGFEVKASRADLKRELADLGKHRALARYCDTWTLVVWDESVIADLDLPETWGIWLTRDGEYGREIVKHRKAAKLTPEPWPPLFVASLVRNAYQQSPHAGFVARAVAETQDRMRAEYARMKHTDMRAELRPLVVAMFGENPYRWPDETRTVEGIIRLAAEHLTQGSLLAKASNA